MTRTLVSFLESGFLGAYFIYQGEARLFSGQHQVAGTAMLLFGGYMTGKIAALLAEKIDSL
jgi:hypothetical protein